MSSARFQVVAMVLSSCAALSSAAGASVPKSEPHVSIRIDDYAQVDAQSWQRTEQQVSETYRTAGVRIEWRAVARPAEVRAGRARWPDDPPAVLTVVVAAQETAAPVGMADDVAGYAPITNGHSGRIAFVFANRTRNIAGRAGVAHDHVLAAVIAHEVAHLLMPERPHSADGLMRAHWVPDQFRRVGHQHFSADEATALRQSVRALTGTGGRIAD